MLASNAQTAANPRRNPRVSPRRQRLLSRDLVGGAHAVAAHGHAQLGEAPKARNMYERGLELEPDHGRLKEALTEIR